MTDRYRTVAREAQAVFREKASRFIAFAFPINDQEEFKQKLEAIAREHHSARHLCYAWVLGDDGSHQRSNDAGEPAGTAGKPILNRILAAGLTYTAVVVVRYFGGTLLGKSGLIAAYGESASMAIVQAGSVEKLVLTELKIVCTHAQFETIKKEVAAMEGSLIKSTFSSKVEAIVAVPKSLEASCRDRWNLRGISVEDAV
jgi:uncharacterized YigZ family protein